MSEPSARALPIGDPEAMRAFALALRSEAETIAARAAALGTKVRRMKFEGPAANDFYQRMLQRRRASEIAAGDLKEVSNYLLSASARLETEIAEWRRNFDASRGVGA